MNSISGLSANNLKSFYETIILFLKSKCLRVYELTATAFKATQYDLLSDTIWSSIIQAIIHNMPALFRAGNPDIFYQNYNISMKFVSEFESLCLSCSAINTLRGNSTYQDFMKKWQLQVYYQIR